MGRNIIQKVLDKLGVYKERIENWWDVYGRYKFQKILHPKACFLVLTPVHGNLGDHALAYSEKQILEKLGIKHIEITAKDVLKFPKKKCLKLFNSSIVFVNGGGFLGTLWIRMENLLREVIKKNQESKFFLFPNTFYYEDSEWGNSELEKSKSIYKKDNVYLYAREQISYEAMQKAYGKCVLMPDMVLRLNELSCSQPIRSGCIISLRKDCEKTRTQEQEDELLKKVQKIFGEEIRFMDTVKEYSIPIEKREDELKKFFAGFGKAELVITDRLHGMIFAAISGTPCIVIDSKSPKLRGCYEWIRELEYVKFCDDISMFEDVYNSLPKGPQKYDNSHLMPYYEQLENDILNTVKKKRKK